MQESNLENITNQENNIDILNDEPTIIQTDAGAKDGQNKCPKCGATDIDLNVNSGKLRCNFCRYEFNLEKISEFENDITNLHGQVMGSGTQDIVADTSDVLTFKCSSCGAEVVIDTSSSTQARCHWCRNTLSVNQQIPNGSIPDVVLPFQISKDVAKTQIEQFVKKRKFFANTKFKKEFTTENIMGVYFPYMVVDINSHVKLAGQGEHLVKTYTRSVGNHTQTYYDADLYNVEREFDLVIDGLTVESSSDRLDNQSSNQTNNIINAIMPFDIENCVRYNANYLKGYTSERRDTNVEQLKSLVDKQSKDIARVSANDTLEEYDRGVAWTNEQFDVKGQRWEAAYLPVWLYSYRQVSGNKTLLHYVAVNARTKETMGSVPINKLKLIGISALIEILGILMMFFIESDYNWIFLSLGIIYFIVMFQRYRNSDARHIYENETKTQKYNISKKDDYIKRLTGLKNSKIDGVNNAINIGSQEKVFESIKKGSNKINKIISKLKLLIFLVLIIIIIIVVIICTMSGNINQKVT